MTANNDWPGKPGVPMNPERDGWHWLETPDGERAPYEWRSAGECERGRWPSYWVSQGEDCWEAPACKYLGPVLTPDEATALQKRVAELEVLTRAKVTEIERAHSHEGHCIECHGAVRAWGDTEHRDDCWYVKARAALERKE